MKYMIIVILLSILSSVSVSGKHLYFLVHPKNLQSELVIKKAKNIILKKNHFWDNGSSIKVFMPNHDAFPVIIDKILGMDQLDWEEYWGKQKLQTGSAPPKILKSELAIIRNISKNKKAIGIITDSNYNDSIKKIVRVILKVEI
ncbi:MAG: hypothetical protein HOO06_07900 [Bdellovibrionaceae bacterium]|jgi:hypothetical protein|nr:hypothetical protein [Pseudobdellovibrionaceae bacterium]